MDTAAMTWADWVNELASASRAAVSDFLAIPFDVARLEYGRAVRMGLLERSMLASANYGRWLKAMERLTLGPLAR